MHQNGLIVLNRQNKVRNCYFCNSRLLIDANTWFYDKKWFHEECMRNFEKHNVVIYN